MTVPFLKKNTLRHHMTLHKYEVHEHVNTKKKKVQEQEFNSCI